MRHIARFAILVAGLTLVTTLVGGPSAELAGRRWHAAASLAGAGEIGPSVAIRLVLTGRRWS
jgi:hypothetical protein